MKGIYNLFQICSSFKSFFSVTQNVSKRKFHITLLVPVYKKVQQKVYETRQKKPLCSLILILKCTHLQAPELSSKLLPNGGKFKGVCQTLKNTAKRLYRSRNFHCI